MFRGYAGSCCRFSSNEATRAMARRRVAGCEAAEATIPTCARTDLIVFFGYPQKHNQRVNGSSGTPVGVFSRSCAGSGETP